MLASLVVDCPVPFRTGPAPRPAPAGVTCENCGQVFQPPDRRRRLYCQPLCKDTASLVRYARRRQAEHGPVLPPNIHDATAMRMAHVLAGGYPEHKRRLTPEVRRAVKERGQHLCKLCRGPGEQIDHVDGDSNDLPNLRLLCADCHDGVTSQRIRPLPDGHPTRLARAAIMLRIAAAEPLLPCDGADWNICRPSGPAAEGPLRCPVTLLDMRRGGSDVASPPVSRLGHSVAPRP